MTRSGKALTAIGQGVMATQVLTRGPSWLFFCVLGEQRSSGFGRSGLGSLYLSPAVVSSMGALDSHKQTIKRLFISCRNVTILELNGSWGTIFSSPLPLPLFLSFHSFHLPVLPLSSMFIPFPFPSFSSSFSAFPYSFSYHLVKTHSYLKSQIEHFLFNAASLFSLQSVTLSGYLFS